MALDPVGDELSGLTAELSRTAEEIQRGTRTRRLRTGVLVLVFSLALGTLAVELGLRVTHHREGMLEERLGTVNRSWLALSRSRIFESIDDPVRRYAMRPGASCEVEGWRFHVSSQGTRGSDFPLEKPPGEKRLLCVGDSFAFGMGGDDEETLVERLAARASEREREAGSETSWRGINIGVPGYHAGQALRAFEQDGLPLDPDVVLLYFNSNDIETEGFFYADDLGVLRRDFLPLPAGLRSALWDLSYLYGWIATVHARGVESGPTPYLDPRVPFAHVREDNQAETLAALARLTEICRERDLPLFVVHQPLVSYMGDTRDPSWPALPLVEWGETAREELGITGMSLLGWTRGYSDGVDRLAEGAPPEFILDTYLADARIQEALRRAKERALERGKPFEELSFAEQVACFEGLGGELLPPPDFHFTGAGYAHIARVVYPRMQAAGMLP